MFEDIRLYEVVMGPGCIQFMDSTWVPSHCFFRGSFSSKHLAGLESSPVFPFQVSSLVVFFFLLFLGR